LNKDDFFYFAQFTLSLDGCWKSPIGHREQCSPPSRSSVHAQNLGRGRTARFKAARPTVEWCVQTSRLPIEGGSVRSVVGIPYGSEGGLSCEDNYLRDGGIGWESSQSAAKLRRMGSPRKLGAGFSLFQGWERKTRREKDTARTLQPYLLRGHGPRSVSVSSVVKIRKSPPPVNTYLSVSLTELLQWQQ
jgi:hypothetical protein